MIHAHTVNTVTISNFYFSWPFCSFWWKKTTTNFLKFLINYFKTFHSLVPGQLYNHIWTNSQRICIRELNHGDREKDWWRNKSYLKYQDLHLGYLTFKWDWEAILHCIWHWHSEKEFLVFGSFIFVLHHRGFRFWTWNGRTLGTSQRTCGKTHLGREAGSVTHWRSQRLSWHKASLRQGAPFPIPDGQKAEEASFPPPASACTRPMARTCRAARQRNG